jgi:hypothetical protein
MHVVERVDFLLNVVPVSSVGVEHLRTWGWCLKLGLLGFVVVVVVLVLVIDLMVDVVYGVGEGVEVLLFVFLRHERVVLLLFETHLDRDAAAMQEGLSVQEADGKQGALFVFVVYKGPELGLLQSDGFDFSEEGEDLVESFSGGLSGQ